jgi:hypothetical protein
MKIRTAILLIPTLLILFFLVVSAQQSHPSSITKHRLAIEIGLEKPWTLNAAREGQTLRAFIRLPAEHPGLAYSAIKLIPRMNGEKLEVTISALAGDLSTVKSCKDWAMVKETSIGSYTLSEGQEVTVPNLSNLGQNFKNGVLTFKAVSFMPDIEPVDGGGEGGSTPCGCGRCDRLYCCPNKGACLGCGTCGDVCCGN